MLPVRPPVVPPGSLVGVVAPAGPIDLPAFNAGIELLHAWGYRTLVGEHVYDRQGYLAGTDQDRARDFNQIWANPEVKAVIAARGGYGVMRMLPWVDWSVIRRQPKFFCGFSDITALHLAILKESGLVTFHGPMVAAFGDLAYNGPGLRRAMQVGEPLGQIPWPEQHNLGRGLTGTAGDLPANPISLVPGVAEGRLIGGNLTLINAMLGTPWEPDLRGAILLLEDVDEAPYRVDRMLTQLRLAGKLQGIAGILFGDSPSCTPAPGKASPSLVELLAERLGDLQVPVLYGFPCGHTAYRATLPLGVRVRLDATAGSLTIVEPALAEG